MPQLGAGLPHAQKARWGRHPAWGWGWNVVPGVRVLQEARPTPHSSLGRDGCLSLPGQGRRTQPWGSGNGLMTLSTHLAVPLEQRACHVSARDQMTQDGDSSARPRARDLHQPHRGNGALARSARRKKARDLKANKRETKFGTLRQLHDGQAGRQIGQGVFGAWQMQGLIAGASHGADPGTSSGDAGGNDGAGLDHSLPVVPGPPYPPSFQSFGQGSPGQLWDLTLPLWAPRRRRPGKWDRSG